jgi:threonine/homoserine/homoserine lactone efflux protein
LFFLSFLPQFVTGPVADASRQMLRLGAIYMLLTLIVYGALGYCAGHASRWLREGRVRSARLRWLTAGSFIGLGVWAALPDHR